MLELDTIYNEDCLEGMKRIPDGSIDCIICDLPYGTTACKWDTVIPFEPLWEQYHRICKENAPIILFGSEPFSTMLRASNINEYRYDWIWVKTKAGNFQICKVQPLKLHEIISVFYRKMPTYNNTELQPCHIKTGRAHKGKHITKITSDPNYIQTKQGYNKSVRVKYKYPLLDSSKTAVTRICGGLALPNESGKPIRHPASVTYNSRLLRYAHPRDSNRDVTYNFDCWIAYGKLTIILVESL